MNAGFGRGSRVCDYMWATVAVAVMLTLGSIWWAGSAECGERGGAMAGNDPVGSLPGLSVSDEARVCVTPVVPKPERSEMPNIQPAGRKLGRAGKVSVRDMFPVGNIAQHAPRMAHPYRTIPELFGSFEYDGRLWMPTGRFARWYQVELVPLGPALNGRGLYALANTSAPSAALFVQSGRDPHRFAIYR